MGNTQPNPTVAIYANESSQPANKRAAIDCAEFAKIRLDAEWLEKEDARCAIDHLYNEGDTSTLVYNDDKSDSIVVMCNHDAVTNAKQVVEYIASKPSVNHVVARNVSDYGLKLIEAVATNSWAHAIHDDISLQPDEYLRGPTRTALTSLTSDRINGDKLFEGIKHSGGRPPLGTTSQNGVLRPDENYDHVCSVLKRVDDPEDPISKQRAATTLDCTVKTIDAALERRYLYQLDQ